MVASQHILLLLLGMFPVIAEGSFHANLTNFLEAPRVTFSDFAEILCICSNK